MTARLLPTLVIAVLLAAGCASTRSTQPPHTANEELLMSRAVDEATAQIDPNLPRENAVFVDASDFKADTDRHYAISAISDRLLACGYRLADGRGDADTIAAIRSGALSINRKDKLWLGIPSVTLPVPLAGPLETPGLDLFRTVNRTGVAKFGLSFYDADTGAIQDSVGPVYGFSHLDRHKILMIGWTNGDLIPAEARDDS